MLIGLCASALSAQEVLAASPVDYLEEHVQNFLAPEAPEPEFTERLSRVAKARKPVVTANCFLPGHLKCVGDEVDMPRILAYAARAFARARAAGIDTIVFGSGGSRQVPEGVTQARGFAQFVSLLRALGPIAEPHAVTVVVEPLNRGECNLVNTVDEGAEAVKQADHRSVRLLADIYHMLRNDETPDAIRTHGALLRHVHIAEREKRSAPGVAGDDFRPFLSALRHAGYDHRLSFECGWTDMSTELPTAVTELRRQLAESGY